MVVVEVSDDTCIACDNNKDAPAFVRAYVYATYPSGLTAAFCAHHGLELRASKARRYSISRTSYTNSQYGY